MKEFIKKAAEEHMIKIEEYINLRIQPKPGWLPDFVWKKILKRLLVLEKLQGGLKVKEVKDE